MLANKTKCVITRKMWPFRVSKGYPQILFGISLNHVLVSNAQLCVSTLVHCKKLVTHRLKFNLMFREIFLTRSTKVKAIKTCVSSAGNILRTIFLFISGVITDQLHFK